MTTAYRVSCEINIPTHLIHQKELQSDQLCNLLIGGLAEIELGLVLAIKTERVMQRARGDNRSWLFNVGSCYKRYLPRKWTGPLELLTHKRRRKSSYGNLRNFIEVYNQLPTDK